MPEHAKPPARDIAPGNRSSSISDWSEKLCLPRGKKWWLAVVPGGHVGSGRQEEREVVVIASDAVAALKIVTSKVHGWKRNRLPLTVREITDEAEVVKVLDEIASAKNVTLDKVLRDGYFYRMRLN